MIGMTEPIEALLLLLIGMTEPIEALLLLLSVLLSVT